MELLVREGLLLDDLAVDDALMPSARALLKARRQLFDDGDLALGAGDDSVSLSGSSTLTGDTSFGGGSASLTLADTAAIVGAVDFGNGGGTLGTLIDPRGTVFGRSDALGQAESSAFAYDSGVMHCGPGRSRVEGPFPAYDVSRVFFILTKPALPAAGLVAHQKVNCMCGEPAQLDLSGLLW